MFPLLLLLAQSVAKDAIISVPDLLLLLTLMLMRQLPPVVTVSRFREKKE